jgi:hypothetical protein
MSLHAARLCELTRDASSYFERGEVNEARRYGDILRAFPDDPVAMSLLAMCSANLSLAVRNQSAGMKNV